MITMKRIFLAFAFLAMVLGCSSDDDSSPTPEQETSQINLTKILLGFNESDNSYAMETVLYYTNEGVLDSTVSVCPTCFPEGPEKYYYNQMGIDWIDRFLGAHSQLSYENGKIVTRANYDSAGELDSSIEYLYDNSGNISEISGVYSPGAPPYIVTLEYNSNGDITKRQEPVNPYYTTYEYLSSKSAYSLPYNNNYRQTQMTPLYNRSKTIYGDNDEILYEIIHEYEFNDEGFPIKETRLRDGEVQRIDLFFYEEN